ncbi:serum amyloid P-component-like isoform X1 [Clupea harengus]|uniref:Serum amyloid P-component-like isoform X1 n=1 Tax=Clupea harengus TaxID=7950 RepID=A0A6P3W2K5_CLUHA|nr:serum amyloid P-component-like isoform X1 [Clupea harengus]
MMANSLVYGLVLVCMITGTTGSFMVTDNPYEQYTTHRWPDWTATREWYWTTPRGGYWTSSPSPGQDLTGRMFSVMSGSVVTFRGPLRYGNINAFTVCLRIIAEATPGAAIFTLTTSNSATLTLRSMPSGYELTVGQASKNLQPVSAIPSFGKLWPWTSLCVTWDSNTGMTQMWKDGKMSVRKGMWRGQNFYGPATMTLSGFEGQVTDIHMWDKVLPLSGLRSYNQGWGYPFGNMLSWRDMGYTSQGYAILENAFESQGGPAEKDSTGKQQRRHWRRHGELGNVVQGGADSVGGCFGLRKRCGKSQVLLE